MEWQIMFTSKEDTIYVVNIDTISNLRRLVQNFDESLLIDLVQKEITIYDDYVE